MTDNKSGLRNFCSAHPVIFNLLLLCVVAMLLLFVAIPLFTRFITNHGQESIVPEIKGLNYAQAVDVLNRNDLTIEISDSIYDRSLQPGIVIESWPKAGAVVKRHRKVYVTVNAFSPKNITISMPVSGVSMRQAMSYLQSLGFTAVRIVTVPSQFDGLVERATANGYPINIGSIVPVTASITLEVGEVPTYDEEAEEGLDDDVENADTASDDTDFDML